MLGQHGDLLLRRLVKYQQVALLGADGELGRHLAPLQKGGIAQVGLELLNLPGGQLPDWNLAILVLEDGKGFSVLVPFDFKRSDGGEGGVNYLFQAAKAATSFF